MKRFEARWLWQRRAAVLLVTVLASSMAMAGWAMWSSSDGTSPPRVAAPPSEGRMASAPRSQAREQQEFEHQCLDVMRNRLFRAALKRCSAYLAHPRLAGAAHTVMAAIHTDAGYLDTAASVEHTQRAVQLGDPKALFLLALHAMAGNTPELKVDPGELLRQAKAGGVGAARVHLQALQDSEQCRRDAKALPLGQPLFCLSRAELHEALAQQGMSLRRRDDLQWQDEFSPGDVLAQAQSVHAQFDVDPRDSIHRLARLNYMFNSASAERRAQLAASLARRYGPAATSPAAAGESIWSLPDGVVIRLQGARADGLALVYEHAQRWEGRGQHLQSQQAQVELDRVKADASVL